MYLYLCKIHLDISAHICYNINKIREAENPKPQKGNLNMNDVKTLVEKMNNNLFSKYILLNYSADYSIAILEYVSEYGSTYSLYKRAYHDGRWNLDVIRPFSSKEKAYAAYNALTN